MTPESAEPGAPQGGIKPGAPEGGIKPGAPEGGMMPESAEAGAPKGGIKPGAPEGGTKPSSLHRNAVAAERPSACESTAANFWSSTRMPAATA